jgi:hypothetical protein
MIALANAPVRCEAALDVDDTMATLVAEPWWELCTLGLRMDGTIAVPEWYTRVFARVVPHDRRLAQRSITFGDAYVIIEHDVKVDLPGERLRTCPQLTFYCFEGEKLLGERAHPDRPLAELYEAPLSADFLRLPGVAMTT